jgi:hypothetical protein
MYQSNLKSENNIKTAENLNSISEWCLIVIAPLTRHLLAKTKHLLTKNDIKIFLYMKEGLIG